MLHLPTIFSAVTGFTGLLPSLNRLYNIKILTTVLQLPTVFGTVTCCTGL